jgi:cytoplasmic iron level regulating protein YaaA (DUF328/UPF0246 family)
MLAIISPAKTLDFTSKLTTRKHTEPAFVADSQALIENLRSFAPHEVSSLMRISDNLGDLNYQRYRDWQPNFSDRKAARPAVLAFKGDVYIGLQAATLGERDLTWAQKHVRILSGLHGLLRPLDRIRPYRLEMGTKLKTERGNNLYDYWGCKVTHSLNEAIAEQKQKVLINLASKEYFAVLQPTDIDARIINVGFKELRGGQYRFLSFFAKKARGLMTRYMIENRISTLKALRGFDLDGYTFNASLSQGDNWVFTRG